MPSCRRFRAFCPQVREYEVEPEEEVDEGHNAWLSWFREHAAARRIRRMRRQAGEQTSDASPLPTLPLWEGVATRSSLGAADCSLLCDEVLEVADGRAEAEAEAVEASEAEAAEAEAGAEAGAGAGDEAGAKQGAETEKGMAAGVSLPFAQPASPGTTLRSAMKRNPRWSPSVPTNGSARHGLRLGVLPLPG